MLHDGRPDSNWHPCDIALFIDYFYRSSRSVDPKRHAGA